MAILTPSQWGGTVLQAAMQSTQLHERALGGTLLKSLFCPLDYRGQTTQVGNVTDGAAVGPRWRMAVQL